MTNEDKKIVADYMGWSTWEAHDGSSGYFIPSVKPKIYFDLNDAGLVVKEMQKRGEWVYFYDDLLDTYNDLCEDGKVSCGAENFTAWIFNSENFFKAFVEWRKLEAIKRAEGSIPPFNHKHCFDSDGKCSCGLLEEFYKETK